MKDSFLSFNVPEIEDFNFVLKFPKSRHIENIPTPRKTSRRDQILQEEEEKEFNNDL